MIEKKIDNWLKNNQLWRESHSLKTVYKYQSEVRALLWLNSEYEKKDVEEILSIDNYKNIEKVVKNTINNLIFNKKLDIYEDKDKVVNKLYHEIIFKIITDKDWNSVSLDLEKIWVKKFGQLAFWDWEIWKLYWKTLLNKVGDFSSKWLKQVLSLWWIERPDLPSEDINYENKEHLKKVLSVITDKDWNSLNINLEKISTIWFKESFFWYWTNFWLISWFILLKNSFWLNSKWLKQLLAFSWIKK